MKIVSSAQAGIREGTLSNLLFNQPVPVAVVKTEIKTSVLVGQIIGSIGGIFLMGWLLNMIIPAVTPWELGYWQCIWLYIGCDILFKKSTLVQRFSDLKDK